jgi:hypothetical protein
LCLGSARSGQLAGCLLKAVAIESKGACKINFESGEIKLYQESGDGLTVLNNQKATKALTISTQSVSSI